MIEDFTLVTKHSVNAIPYINDGLNHQVCYAYQLRKISARMIITIITPQEFENIAFHSSCSGSVSIRLLRENKILIIRNDFEKIS